MNEERQVRPGFLPPRAPGVADASRVGAPVPAGSAPERPQFVTQRMESGPRSPLALAGTVIGAIAILLLLLSLGLGYFVCGTFSVIALMLGLLARQQIQQRGTGRAGQARAAIWVGGIGLTLSIIAAITWLILEANGFAPEELRDWLEERLEAQRTRG